MSLSEPLPVAETFTFEDESGASLSKVARLDTMVTVVDAYNFLRDYASSDLLQQLGESLGEADDRSVVDLLVEHIEFCDVLVVNKTDLVTPTELDRLVAILRALNPRARIELSSFGKLPLDRVLDTGLFDFEAAAQAPGWLAELRGEHVPETVEYGITSFTYQARRPFHPERFWNLIHREWAGVVRSKGFFWLASRPELAGSWSQAGGTCRHGPAGYWWDAVPQEYWPQDPEHRARIAEKSQGEWGDRRQELVFIGMDMNEADIRAQLDACLLTDAEMALGRAGWVKLRDPFPAWEKNTPEDIETELY